MYGLAYYQRSRDPPIVTYALRRMSLREILFWTWDIVHKPKTMTARKISAYMFSRQRSHLSYIIGKFQGVVSLLRGCPSSPLLRSTVFSRTCFPSLRSPALRSNFSHQRLLVRHRGSVSLLLVDDDPSLVEYFRAHSDLRSLENVGSLLPRGFGIWVAIPRDDLGIVAWASSNDR